MKRFWSVSVVLLLGACNPPAVDDGTQAAASAATSVCAMDCAAWGQRLTIHSGSNAPNGSCVAGRCVSSIGAFGSMSCDDVCRYVVSPSLACVSAQATLIDNRSNQSLSYKITCDLVPTQVVDLDDGTKLEGIPSPWPSSDDYVLNSQLCACG